MRFVIQVVDNAEVSVDGKVCGSCGKGFLVLIGVSDTDTVSIAGKMCDKMLAMRILPDENGKTNLSLADVDGSLLLVSQFTLYADCKKGNRPSFVKAAGPELAESLYEHIISRCRDFLGADKVGTGIFGEDMKVGLTNSGPFTIILDSAELNC
ncbi:MAG: D-tyrosyl-tRNA(Tyr) deacylase [Clostridiales bacterium]|nr:D-tyrosyl-tRNA(Tyr) deacylase [Clostridiales bacterium]